MSAPKSRKIFGVVKGNRLHRLTFSEGLAKFLLKYDDEYRVQTFRVKRGESLNIGQTSKTGFYMIATEQCGTPLRVTPIKDLAAMQADGTYRRLFEAELIKT